MSRCLRRLGALPETLVWDRERAIHAGGGRPTAEFAAFCGQLGVGWIILDPGDAEAKGVLERSHRFLRSSFEPGRRFASQRGFQDPLDGWADKANGRVHGTTRVVSAERSASTLTAKPSWSSSLSSTLGERRRRDRYTVRVLTRTPFRPDASGSRRAADALREGMKESS
jgi:hypothetical protein